MTVAPAVETWGFGVNKQRRVPAAEQVAVQRGKVDWRALDLDPAHRTASKGRQGLQVDLGGIAKGYGVDAVAKSLDGLGIAHYMIEVGGEVRTRGVNAAGEPWQIGIEEPDATPQRARHIVPLSGRAMATSGDYRIYFEEGGRRYSHEIDPTTAAPIAHRLCSVTVVADDCMRADGLATALIVLGPERGFELAEAQRRGRAVHRTRGARPLQRPHDVGLRRPRRASGGMSFATLGTVFVLAAVLIGAAVLAMAVGRDLQAAVPARILRRAGGARAGRGEDLLFGLPEPDEEVRRIDRARTTRPEARRPSAVRRLHQRFWRGGRETACGASRSALIRAGPASVRSSLR